MRSWFWISHHMLYDKQSAAKEHVEFEAAVGEDAMKQCVEYGKTEENCAGKIEEITVKMCGSHSTTLQYLLSHWNSVERVVYKNIGKLTSAEWIHALHTNAPSAAVKCGCKIDEVLVLI
jgi:hypothetical protein